MVEEEMKKIMETVTKKADHIGCIKQIIVMQKMSVQWTNAKKKWKWKENQ